MEEVIKIYTDGACSGNPGKAGCGAVIIYPDGREFYLSYYLGDNLTNNIAELNAIYLSVKSLKNKNIPIVIYSDSQYSIGVLTKNKAKKNQELISKIKDELNKFNNIQFIKVKGHSKDHYNNLADHLATESIRKHNLQKYL